MIRSREHLLHMLAEAAELEHNLLCSYLYAVFSLKQSAAEDLLPHEWEAVERWRADIMGVCTEEMIHLAQVANLTVAVGSRPHFDRPNLPVAPGYHPAGIHIALTPFDLDTLDHFIYLERPDGSDVGDGAGFPHRGDRRVATEAGHLMPSSPDYETIGDFYKMIEDGLAHLADRLGEESLFNGPSDYQMTPDEIGSQDLSVVTGLAGARAAIQSIVVQGEGSSASNEDSHYGRFVAIRDEYVRLRHERAAFTPIRAAARNPVMRRPQAADRVHVVGTASAPVLDAANAAYSLLVRCLVELFETSSSAPDRRAALLGATFGLMRTMGGLACELSALPATDDAGACNAGITFAMLRSTEGLAPGVDSLPMLCSRFADIAARLPELDLDAATTARLMKGLAASRQGLDEQVN